jgi:CheY-like chemotaxis protein
MNKRSDPIQILLVEDSDDDAFFFRWTLQKTGLPFDCRHAVDGYEAIQILEKARSSGPFPEAIFLDLKMPTLSGFDVLQWMQEQKFHPPLNVLVLSGSDQESDVRRARLLGVDRYLVKPVRSDQFIEFLGPLRPEHSTESPCPSPSESSQA